jgi:hypothetical protein
MPITSYEVEELTLGPLTARQRADIMGHATGLSIEARRVFRHLLILNQDHGLTPESIARAAAQARAHFEN